MSGIRISGLESKIDIEDTIQKLVEARSHRIERYEHEKEEIGYNLQAWGEVAIAATDMTRSLNTLRSWDIWNRMAARSSDEMKLTATASTAAAPSTYNVEVNQLAQAQNIGGERVSALVPNGRATTDLVAAGVLTAGESFTIEGETITIGEGETLNSLVGKINTASSAMAAESRVRATVLDDRLVIMREQTGTGAVILADTGGTVLQDMGVLNALGEYENELMTGRDASFTVNGALIERSSNTGINDVITGVTLNLHGVTLGVPVRLEVSNDVDEAREAINEFVENYNILAEICRFFTQKPLGGEGMGGARIEALGELHDDSVLLDIERSIRRFATGTKFPTLNQTNASFDYNGQKGVANSLQALGIWTSGEQNQLSVLDSGRLDHMLQNEFELCAQLFRGVFNDEQGYANGVATDFYRYMDKVTSSMTGDIARRTKSLEDKVTDLEERIAQQKEELERYEWDLVRQFTVMEQAEARLNAELEWFRQSFGGG